MNTHLGRFYQSSSDQHSLRRGLSQIPPPPESEAHFSRIRLCMFTNESRGVEGGRVGVDIRVVQHVPTASQYCTLIRKGM